MLQKITRLAVGSVLCAIFGLTASTNALSATAEELLVSTNTFNALGKNADAFQRLESENPGARMSINSATDTLSFVVLQPRAAISRNGQRNSGNDINSKNSEAMAFVGRHAQAFGRKVGYNDVTFNRAERDRLGKTRLSYSQQYGGVPVFGARIKAHFDADDQLVAVTGTLVPDIDISIAPSRSAKQAEGAALRFIGATSDRGDLAVRGSRLLIFREGLAQGVPGDNHLAYEVEIGNGMDAREFVYVDAHTGKYIDQITGIYDALNRRVYDGLELPHPPFEYPDAPFWVEGDAFPTVDIEADNMILASEETYDLFANAFGRDSLDGAGIAMDSIFNRGYSCPNASWNGVFISFCQGLTTDDVTGHEWGHAYTDFTDDLIYQWQPGALNESYSDMVGETVDRINGRDDLIAVGARTDGSCSAYMGTPPPGFTVDNGAAAGDYFVTASVNEPPPPFIVGSLPMVHADPADGCALFANAADVAGNLVIIDWEDNGAPAACGSGTRAGNAIAAGAAGIVFVAPASGRLNLGSNPGIASVQTSQADGAAIKASLPADATIEFTLGTDDSYDWLMGEDVVSDGIVGALRDMYTPSCFGDPGKVTDEVYVCGTGDQGGVHSNSGVPNHAFALMVDGGTYNGHTVAPIGLTKANHIQFYAKTHYQGPATDFVGHADALEQSCADLMGTNLASLMDGTPSGEVIAAADCAEVTNAIAAVELRTLPDQCGFEPLLAKSPPPLCPAGYKKPKKIFSDNFNKSNKGSKGSKGSKDKKSWTLSHDGTTEDFTDRDWMVVSDLPDDRKGKAYYGPAQGIGTCAPGGDETAVLHLDSPEFQVKKTKGSKGSKGNGPAPRELRMAFDHWMATEAGWDGGNVKISVNGGPWVLIDYTDFVYNSYNVFLFSGPQGNSNPIAGEQAFSGTDGGNVGGSWGQSIIDLQNYAVEGDKARLRFDIGNDGCGGIVGWFVDDVKVYQCEAE
jgi:Zn-dependent metalloprotease